MALPAKKMPLIGQRVSQSLVDVVRGLRGRPRYLLAKSCITSSDVATQGLGVRRALVRGGQILPGVPLWSLGAESRFAGMPYVVLPENVGGAEVGVRGVRASRDCSVQNDVISPYAQRQAHPPPEAK